MKCSRCGTSPKTLPKGERSPRGWKRLGEELVCGECWAKAFMLRAVTLPVAGPLDREQWPMLRELLQKGWAQTTALANWAVAALSRSDIVRMPDMEKMPKFTMPYLYTEARKLFPEMTPSSVVAVLNTVQQRYLKCRYDVVWKRSMSLPSYRFPTPYPLPAQAWSARYLSEEQKVPIVSVSIAGQRLDVRLRGGPEFRRQLASFAQLVEGSAKACELAIYRASVSANSNLQTVTDHAAPGGARKEHHRIMMKLVMWLPKMATGKQKEKPLTLQRGEDCFLILRDEAGSEFKLNGDQVVRWILEHRDRLHRLAEDTKYEKRLPPAEQTSLGEYRAKLCHKQNHRLETFCHQSSLMIAERARRQKVTQITWDQKVTPFLSSFPWTQFQTMLEYKLRERGIDLKITGGAREDEKAMI